MMMFGLGLEIEHLQHKLLALFKKFMSHSGFMMEEASILGVWTHTREYKSANINLC